MDSSVIVPRKRMADATMIRYRLDIDGKTVRVRVRFGFDTGNSHDLLGGVDLLDFSSGGPLVVVRFVIGRV